MSRTQSRSRRAGIWARDDTGSAAVELTLLVPVLSLALLLMVVAGRQVSAALITQEAASSAARAASLQRDAASARDRARSAATEELRERGAACTAHQVSVNTADFRPGGTVQVEVTCTVTVVDLGDAGGHRVVSAVSTSPVDPYRGHP